MGKIAGMGTQTWRQRLEQAVREKGRTFRDVSLKAGLAHGYVHAVISTDKDPTVENLIAVCQEIGVSLSFILYGFEMSPETEEILSLLETQPQNRSAILQLLQSRAAP